MNVALHYHETPPRPTSAAAPVAPDPTRAVERETIVIRERTTLGHDEEWWVRPLVLVIVAMLAIFVVARGYAAARGTLIDILLGGGVLALGLTGGTFLGLRGLRTFRGAARAALIAATGAQALCLVNAYLLMHPSWTGGNYEQAFERFLQLGTTFSKAFSDQQSDVTFFLGYQGLGAFIAVVSLILALLSALAISGQVERDAGARVGSARRVIVWVLKRVGGETTAWIAFIGAAGATRVLLRCAL